jgi:hypothetical protein
MPPSVQQAMNNSLWALHTLHSVSNWAGPVLQQRFVVFVLGPASACSAPGCCYRALLLPVRLAVARIAKCMLACLRTGSCMRSSTLGSVCGTLLPECVALGCVHSDWSLCSHSDLQQMSQNEPHKCGCRGLCQGVVCIIAELSGLCLDQARCGCVKLLLQLLPCTPCLQFHGQVQGPVTAFKLGPTAHIHILLYLGSPV